MMRRTLILASLLLVLLPLAAEARGLQFIIVTRTGAQIPAAGPPTFEKNTVRFRTVRGTPLAMNVVNLDVEATERINGVDLPVEVRPVQQAVMTGQPYAPAPVAGTARSAQTITNSDLRNLRVGRGNIFAEAGTEAPVVGEERQMVERAPAPALNKAEWQTRARSILNRQKELDSRRKTLANEIQRLERGMLGVEASQTQKLGAELDRLRQKLTGVQDEMSAAQRQWDRLTREARRANVPESWLR